MGMYSITRRLHFSAGHRLIGHESRCRFIHGHNYVVFIHALATELDEVGRILDFGELKSRIGGWIDENWDHNTILWDADRELASALAPFCRDGKPYQLPYNPTAENLARYLFEVVCPTQMKATGIDVQRVEVQETENCKADFGRGSLWT